MVKKYELKVQCTGCRKVFLKACMFKRIDFYYCLDCWIKAEIHQRPSGIPRFICSSCDKKRPETECFCEQCMRKNLNIIFKFINKKKLFIEWVDFSAEEIKKEIARKIGK